MDFSVVTIEKTTDQSYSHWSKGLTMIIKKGNTTVELNEQEIQQLVSALPRTIGGKY